MKSLEPKRRIARARADSVGGSRMTKKRARTALVSGGLEPVTDAGSGGHSVFGFPVGDAVVAFALTA